MELFKGKDGFKTVLQDVLNTNKDYSVMGSIKHFHKWSTIKKYQKEFKRRTLGDLRIQVNLLLRDGIELGTKPVKFALVFTLTDPDGVASVYDETVVSLRNEGVITNPIQLRSQVQEKIKL